MINVLFVDADHGSRSRMAAAILKRVDVNRFASFSAGVKAGHRNSFAEEVMQEIGIDISSDDSKDILHFVRMNLSFHYIIVLCNENELQQCNLFPSCLIRLHWLFDNPKKFEGTDQSITEQYREQRDLIKKVVKRFVKEIEKGHSITISDLNFEPAIR
ncbi:MAG TPA: hypothetical protein PLD84_11760 [Chitinophagales bacterium]|nr:hypothetical protein [Chitinophagales bacterium]